LYGAARGISRLLARPKGAALWNPAAFVKAGETFVCASRSSFQLLIRIMSILLSFACRGNRIFRLLPGRLICRECSLDWLTVKPGGAVNGG